MLVALESKKKARYECDGGNHDKNDRNEAGVCTHYGPQDGHTRNTPTSLK